MKKIIVFALCLVMALGLCLPAAAAEGDGDSKTQYIQIWNINYDPNNPDNPNKPGYVGFGQEFNVHFDLEVSDFPGTASIKVSGNGFSLLPDDTDLGTDHVEKISSGRTSINLKVKASEDLSGESCPLIISVTYTPTSGKKEPISTNRTINVKVDGSGYTPPHVPEAKIDVIGNSGMASVDKGNILTLPITLRATCDGKNIGGTAEISISKNSSSFYFNGSNIVTVPITDGQGGSTLFICCDPMAAAGKNDLTLVVEFTDTDGHTASCTESFTISVNEVNETESDIQFNITSAPNSPIMAGDTFNVSFTAIPVGAIGYEQGTVTVSGTGFTFAGALAEQNISFGTNGVSVLVDKTVPSGRQLVTFTVKFNVEGKELTASKSINVDVIGNDDSEDIDESKDVASFELTGASIPEGKGRSELSTKLKMSFKNTTGFVAKNVKVRLSALGDIILTTYTDTAAVGDVDPDQTVNATFPIKFPEMTKPQHTVTAEVIFDGPTGPVTESFNVYLQATEKKPEEEAPESAALTPKVIVKNYSTDVEKVISGEEFTLSFVLENTSEEKDLRNMTVNVVPQSITSSASGTSSGPVFSFIDGTSSFYTPILEKSSTREYSIKMKCSASAGAGSYPIQISFNFEYADNGGYSSGNGEMDINMPVEQPIKFELLDWTPPTESGLDGVPISFQYFNKSRNPMNALTITCEGDFEMPQQFVGTVQGSNMDVFSGTIVPVEGAKVGDTKTAALVFTFEDAAGSEQRIEETFDVNIVDGSVGGDTGGDMTIDGGMMGGDLTFDYGGEFGPDGMPVDGENTEEGGGLPLWAKIAIPAGIAVVAIIVIAVVVKKVKAKREEEDDEE